MREVEVCLNGQDWIPINHNCCDYIYNDEMKILLVVVDELAELTQKSGQKDERSKEEDLLKSEILGILQSIAQLGRSAGIHLLLATQRPSADVVPTILRNNLGFRAFCGRAAESGASLVALDNTLATTIKPEPKGEAIVQIASVPAFLRVYYSEFKQIAEYYNARGLDALGYSPGEKEHELNLENLHGNEDIASTPEKLTFEFDSERSEIDKREDQTWEEL